MKKNVGELFKSLITKFSVSIKRFPQAILMAAATVFMFIVLNHVDVNFNPSTVDILKRITMIFALSIPIFLSITIIFERKSNISLINKVLIQTLAILFLVLYYFFLLKDFSFVITSRYVAFLFIFYLIFLVLPQLKNKDSYELYIVNLLLRFLVTYLYAMILYLGLCALIFTVDKLFSANISGKLYLDLLFIVSGIFAPIFFLADIPSIEAKFDAKNYSKVLKVLLLYIVMIIITAYTLIMYAYFVKIIVTKQWPQGIVSNLILWYSIISILTLFLVYPLIEENRWVQKFIKFFPKLILPLMLMLYISMGIRIKAYGLTESRYFVIIAALWVSINMIYLSFIKKPRNILLLISLAIFAFLAVVGPLSSYSLSIKSQNNRFEALLKKNNMLKNNTIVKAPYNISKEDTIQINSILSYFQSKHSFKDMKYIPENFSMDKMNNVFGFSSVYYNEGVEANNYFSFMLKMNDRLFNTKDFDFVVNITGYNTSKVIYDKDDINITYFGDKKEITITYKDKEIYNKKIVDLASMIYEDNKANSSKGYELPKDKLTFMDNNENINITYIFNQISGFEQVASGNVNLESVDFNIFIKIK